MRSTLNRALGICFLMLIPLWALAQEMTFTASASKTTVAVGERFTLKLSLVNAKGRMQIPSLAGFTVVSGPMTAESYSWSNGKAAQSIEVSYVLVATKEGKFTISSAKVETNKGELETDPITISVTKGESDSNTEQAANISQTGDLILNTEVSRRKVHIGEAITVTYYLYSRYNNLQLGKYDIPTLNGFWTEDLKLENSTWESNLVTVNGARYRVAILRRQVVYPQKAGTFSLTPYLLDCYVNRGFFGNGEKITVKSNSRTIEVLPFPANPPANFQEQAGVYKLEASANTYSLKANEAITFKVKISGEGNLKTIKAPNVEFPSDFELYEPKTIDKFKTNAAGINGYREFEYIAIPRLPGEYTIPAFAFVYFDLKSKSYKTLSSGAFTFKVAPGDESAKAGTVLPGYQNKIQANENSFRFISEADLAHESKLNLAPNSLLFWLLFTLVPATFALVFTLHKRKAVLNENQQLLKSSKAYKNAQKQLQAAKKSLSEKNQSAFYTSLSQAIFGYILDKFSLELSQLSQEKISEALRPRLSAVELEQVLATISACEMARFAPSSDGDMNLIYTNAQALIEAIEKNKARS